MADPTQTLQRECLDDRVFATIEDAQAAVDAFVAEYNYDRPHQGIDDAYPADRFQPRSAVDGVLPAVRVPPGLLTPVPAPRAPIDPDAMLVSAAAAEAVEVDRVVPPSGNLMVAQQQIWLGPDRAGLSVVVWVDTDRLHVLGVDGGRMKSIASRLSQRDLARLRADGGRPGRASPLPPVQPELPQAVEVDRLVNAHGCVNLAGRQVSVGALLAANACAYAWTGSCCTSSTKLVTSSAPCGARSPCPGVLGFVARGPQARPRRPTLPARSSTASSGFRARSRSPDRRSG